MYLRSFFNYPHELSVGLSAGNVSVYVTAPLHRTTPRFTTVRGKPSTFYAMYNPALNLECMTRALETAQLFWGDIWVKPFCHNSFSTQVSSIIILSDQATIYIGYGSTWLGGIHLIPRGGPGFFEKK